MAREDSITEDRLAHHQVLVPLNLLAGAGAAQNQSRNPGLPVVQVEVQPCLTAFRGRENPGKAMLAAQDTAKTPGAVAAENPLLVATRLAATIAQMLAATAATELRWNLSAGA